MNELEGLGNNAHGANKACSKVHVFSEQSRVDLLLNIWYGLMSDYLTTQFASGYSLADMVSGGTKDVQIIMP